MPFKDILYFNPLLEKYKNKGAIIDSNLLIYYFIGGYNIKLIERIKKTKNYGSDGYKIISALTGYFNKIITSSHILTEISNLSNLSINEKEISKYYDSFFSRLTMLEELFYPANVILENEKVKKFGLTDSMIFHISKNHPYLVITDDYPLCGFLQSQKIDVINFNNLFGYYLNPIKN